MSNDGFLGTEIRIAGIQIEGRGGAGTVVKYRIQFADKEGRVHGATNHEVEISGDPTFLAPVKELLDAIRSHAEKTHFSSPNHTAKQAGVRGIAEALSRSTDSSDEPGSQG